MKQKAFTLVEFIIVMVVLIIISAGSSLLLTQGFSAYYTGRNILDADWQARVAIERMMRDIRAIGSRGYISTATNNTTIPPTLAFTDINGNTITYTLNSSQQLTRTNTGQNGSPQILADNIQTLTFAYYGATGILITLPASPTQAQLNTIRYIVISLNISYNNISFTITSTVYPWNVL